MSKVTKTLLVSLMIVLVGSSLVLLAQDSGSAAATNALGLARQPIQPPTAVNHVLKQTKINTGAPPTVGPGFTAIDAPTSVTCAGTSGTCTLQADQWIQLGNAAGSDIAICFYIDGVAVNGCYYNGEVPADGFYTMFSVSQGASSIPFGTHTVQTVVYSSSATSGGYYSSTYRVYKP